jgi:hypothetical protein
VNKQKNTDSSKIIENYIAKMSGTATNNATTNIVDLENQLSKADSAVYNK